MIAMEKLSLVWFVLLALLTMASVVLAQDTFPVGAIVGIIFGLFGLCLGVGIPICIWICIFCGAVYASNRQGGPRQVNSIVVSPNDAPRPPTGSYPTQAQPVSQAAYPAYPTANQPEYPAAYPAQPSAPYPDDPPPYTSEKTAY